MKESKIKSRCREILTAKGWVFLNVVNCNLPGWPDTLIMRNGVILFIEFKQPGKTPDDLQLYRHSKIKQHGFDTLIIDNTNQLKQLC